MPSCTKPARSNARCSATLSASVRASRRLANVVEKRYSASTATQALPSMLGEQENPDLEAPSERSRAPCSFPNDYARESTVGQSNYEQGVLIAQVPVFLPPTAAIGRTAKAGPLEGLTQQRLLVHALQQRQVADLDGAKADIVLNHARP